MTRLPSNPHRKVGIPTSLNSLVISRRLLPSLGLMFGLVLAATSNPLFAEKPQVQTLQLSGVFGDNMVLQRDTDAAIWGNAPADAEVTVTPSWNDRATRVTADSEGHWRTSLATPAAGGPHEIQVQCVDATITLTNVLIGEVWICSGQSNMQWKLRGFGAEQFKDDVANANFPNIRFCDVPQVIALEEQQDVRTKWSVCNPSSAYNFSAVAYFFGSRLHQELNVPIGLVSTNWGGSSAEAWTSQATLREQFPEFNEPLVSYRAIIDEQGALHSRSQKLPKGMNQRLPSVLYNSMIKPLTPYAIRGVIWYQGESNVEHPLQYRKLFPAMIRDWRDQWGIGDFPFYFVQIAPFSYKTSPYPAALLREAQSMTLSVPNTGMAVTMDIGNETNIHPKPKKPVGERLARLALRRTYGKSDLVDSGPVYRSMKIQDGQIRLSFDHVGSGLASRDGKQLTHFTIAGEDKEFVPAEATIDEDTIIVRSEQVAAPAAVRFGWGNADLPNLSNQEGLPASSFRTDTWTVPNQE
ncbi:sialate O-acetylesterase [Novipirellula sp. SH528]|uniref:sialate O-acetylesterase n=1 Tax=Novipirellula sp. SH528 TaxID=3454466 RepID=UPI003F9F3E14